MASDPRRPLLQLMLQGGESPVARLFSRVRQGYRPGVSELVYNLISPASHYPEKLAEVHGGMLAGIRHAASQRDPNGRRIMATPAAEDAWRTYLGLPQAHGTLSPSSYRPSQSTDPDARYLSINEAWPQIMESVRRYKGSSSEAQRMSDIEFILSQIESNGGRMPMVMLSAMDNPDTAGEMLAHFQLSAGKDATGPYIAYYDRYDLSQPMEGWIGQPFELYDRLYYDPQTFTALQPQARRRAR